MTCMPCSYCCFVGASPTEAKWPFTVMTEGAVGNLEAAEGRRAEPFASVGVGDDAMIIMCSRSRMTDCLFFFGDRDRNDDRDVVVLWCGVARTGQGLVDLE
jgi:hypothetical protein